MLLLKFLINFLIFALFIELLEFFKFFLKFKYFNTRVNITIDNKKIFNTKLRD